LAPVVLAMVSLAACGGELAPAAGPDRRVVQVTPSPSADTPFAFLSGVDLTAAQRTALTAIADRARPPADEAAAKARADRFAALMSAPTLDEAALATFFREGAQGAAKARAGLVAMYVSVQETLTPSQRVAAAAAIQAQLDSPAPQPSPAPAEQGGEQPADTLALSASQQTLFAATVSPPTDPRSGLKALVTLMRTGNKAPLEAALAPQADPEARVTALVKAFASLTPAQRKQLATRN
jgi:Spy/CpxP family protein refolding chaperone